MKECHRAAQLRLPSTVKQRGSRKGAGATFWGMWMHSDCIFIAIISIIIRSSPSPSFEPSVASWHPRLWRPLWRTHKAVHYPHPNPNIRCCQGVCGRLFLTTERQQESGEDGQRRGVGREKKERWEIIASFPNLGDNSLQFSLTACYWVCAPITRTPQRHGNSIRRPVWGCFFFFERRRGGEKRRGFPLSLPGRHVV